MHILKYRHVSTLTHARAIMYIIPDAYSMYKHAGHWRGWGRLPETQPPTSRPLYFDVPDSPHTHTHSHIPMLTPSAHTNTLCRSLGHIHSPLLLLWISSSILMQSSQDTKKPSCLWNVVHTICPIIAIVPHTHKATKFNLVMVSCSESTHMGSNKSLQYSEVPPSPTYSPMMLIFKKKRYTVLAEFYF